MLKDQQKFRKKNTIYRQVSVVTKNLVLIKGNIRHLSSSCFSCQTILSCCKFYHVINPCVNSKIYYYGNKSKIEIPINIKYAKSCILPLTVLLLDSLGSVFMCICETLPFKKWELEIPGNIEQAKGCILPFTVRRNLILWSPLCIIGKVCWHNCGLWIHLLIWKWTTNSLWLSVMPWITITQWTRL